MNTSPELKFKGTSPFCLFRFPVASASVIILALLAMSTLLFTGLGHVQRGGTPTHYDRLLASRMGEMAVLALQSGERGSMVATVNGKMQLRDFDEILSKRKQLPADSIRLARNIGIELGDAVES
jgi:6-phosphofructokinase